MSHPPVVTVVIPTYNHAHFLRDALRSLCAQTYTDWEAIVVNNFSEDDTVAVVESFDDSRIRLENFRNNGVIAASRNRGIALARGRYVAFLDSDDTWYPDKLARCMKCFDNGVGLVCHGLRWIGDQERDVFCGPEQRATFDALLDEGNCITPSATVVLKDLVESVGCFSENPAIVTSEDYHLWIKLAQRGIKIHFIKEILGQYRVHSGNQSSSVLRHLNSVLCVVDEFFPNADSRSLGMRMRVRRRYGIAHYGAGRAMQRSGQFAQSWPLLFRALAYWPFFGKAYAAIALNAIGRGRIYEDGTATNSRFSRTAATGPKASLPKGIFQNMNAWRFGVVLLLAVSLGIYIGIVRGLLFGIILPDETSMSGLIPSDALYYVSMASNFTLEEILDLGYYNILGPVSFIKLMGMDPDLLFFAQVAGLTLALRELGRHTGVQVEKFAFLLLANPLVLLNLVSPNKEITAILAILFIVVYINSGRFVHASAGIGFAILSKLEILALLLVFLGIRKFRPERRPFLLAILLVLVSFSYKMFADVAERAQILMAGQTTGSAGITVMLHDLAAQYYLFVVVMIPRLGIVVLEGIINLVRGDPGEMTLLVPIAWSGIMFVTTGLSVVRKSRLRLSDDVVFLLILIMIMVAMVPFVQHRYLLPAYPLLLFLALRPKCPHWTAASRAV